MRRAPEALYRKDRSLIKLTDEMKTAVDNALVDGNPMMIANVDPDGQPNLSFRGSTQAYSDEQLAIWVRNPEGGILKNILVNPKLALMYRNREKRQAWIFHGEARRDDDPGVREQVFDNSPEVERNADPDRKGVAIIIDLVRVIARGEVLMER